MTSYSYIKTLKFLQIILLAGYCLSIGIVLLLANLEIVPLLPEMHTNEYIDVVAIASGVAGVIAAFSFFNNCFFALMKTTVFPENFQHSKLLSSCD